LQFVLPKTLYEFDYYFDQAISMFVKGLLVSLIQT